MNGLPLNLTHRSAIIPEPWREREGYLSCSYCGSMETQQLLAAFRSGTVAEWSGSDWKYGFPHKFYIDLESGQPHESYYYVSVRNGETPPAGAPPYRPGDRFHEHHFEVDEQAYNRWYGSKGSGRKEGTGRITAKFYTEHLKDLAGDPETFAALADELERRLGIHFELQDGEVMYRAPRHGFQTWGERPQGGV